MSEVTREMLEQVERRIDTSDALKPHKAYIMADWPEGAEHWNWVLTADESEIVQWAEAGTRDRDNRRYTLTPIEANADSVESSDLRDVFENPEEGTDAAGAECYIINLIGENGYQTGEHAIMLFLPREQRAGIDFGGGAVWTDAGDADEAVNRWLDDEMIN